MDKQKAEEMLIQNRYELYKIAYTFLKNEQDSMDAVQDTIVKAFKNLIKLRDDKAFIFWIKQILVNECRGILKKRQRVIPMEEEFVIDQGEGVDKKELNIYLSEAIDKLTNKEKEVIVLYYMEDMDIRTISDFLKCPEGTVKSRMNSAKMRLRRILGEEDRD